MPSSRYSKTNYTKTDFIRTKSVRTDTFNTLKDKDAMSKHLKKTKPCRFFKNGKCKHGKMCNYAHSMEELNMPKCVFDTRCRRRKTCSFLHSDETADDWNKRNNIYDYFPKKIGSDEIKPMLLSSNKWALLAGSINEDDTKNMKNKVVVKSVSFDEEEEEKFDFELAYKNLKKQNKKQTDFLTSLIRQGVVTRDITGEYRLVKSKFSMPKPNSYQTYDDAWDTSAWSDDEDMY